MRSKLVWTMVVLALALLPALADIGPGETVRASVAADGTQGNEASFYSTISADGRYVLFSSEASNLVAGDTNAKGDLFVKDLLTGEVRVASKAPDGSPDNTPVNTLFGVGGLGDGGRQVVFAGLASNLVVGDTNGKADVFVHNTGFVSQRTTFLTLPAPAFYVGKGSTLVATLREKDTLTPVQDVSVRFFFDRSLIGTATTNIDGKAKLSWVVPEGTTVATHRLQARFSGDPSYKASSSGKDVAVQKGPVLIRVPNKSAAPGAAVWLSAKLLNASRAPLAGRTLSFKLDGTVVGTGVTNSLGLATKKVTVPSTSGSYTITVDFAGDDSHTSGVGNGLLTVG